jgi:hypothetical protein
MVKVAVFALIMVGPLKTVKLAPSLVTPRAVTTKLPFPGIATSGTAAVISVSLQLVVDAVVPLNVTVPVVPKFVPVIVT